MRKVILYIAMSLDGYIADKDRNVDWLNGDGSEPENFGSYIEFIDTVDTVILGYKTYHQIVTELSPDVWAYEGKQSYVITHKNIQPTNGITFTGKNLGELIAEIKNKDGKAIWICGGSAIANQLIDLDLIDTYTISIIPTILGDGIRLFDTHKIEHQLKLISTRNYNGITDLVYEKRI